MVLNETNTNFVREGAKSKQELLESEKVIIYKTSSSISGMSYAGPATKITKSTTIPEACATELANIKGFVSLGTTKILKADDNNELKGGIAYKNAHIYSSKARFLDGVERICYIYRIGDDKIGVSECNGTKGSSYSSLYLILKNKLIKNDFKQNLPYDSFIINSADVGRFVDVVNEVIIEHESGNYELIREEGKFDCITLGKGEEQKKYYYAVAYWQDKNLNKKQDNINNVDDMIDRIIEKLESTNEIKEVENILKKLDGAVTIGNARKTIINTKKNI